jgi:hypothetical protein
MKEQGQDDEWQPNLEDSAGFGLVCTHDQAYERGKKKSQAPQKPRIVSIGLNGEEDFLDGADKQINQPSYP